MEGRERSALVVSGGALLLALAFSFLVIRQSWRMHFGGNGGKGRVLGFRTGLTSESHPGGNPGQNLKSIPHRCHPILVAFVWELTTETIYLPLGCLQGGSRPWKLWAPAGQPSAPETRTPRR